MSGIKNYSTTAASNNFQPPNGWPENMLASKVNDTGRQMMADTRDFYENMEWRDWGHTVTQASATTFTVATDVTSIYTVNRPIRCTDSATLYGYVSASSYSSPNTTVTVVLHSGSLSASLTAVALGIDGGTNSVPIQALSGLTATGDLLYASAANTPTRLAIGTSGQVPSVNATGTGFSYWAPRGHIAGLTLSNDGVSPNTVIDIAAGECTDATNVAVMKLASAITKTTGAWAAGTGSGGLDTGAVANSTWYHVYIIRKDSDGTIDALLSTSASSPTMPAGYTYKRRIGSIKTDGSGNLLAFKQIGDHFYWSVPTGDVNTTNPGTSAVLATLNVPLGVKVKAMFGNYLRSTTTSIAGLITSPDQTDTAPSLSGPHTNVTYSGTTESAAYCECYTNTSSQIRYRLTGSDGNVIVRFSTTGWMDTRGRFD